MYHTTEGETLLYLILLVLTMRVEFVDRLTCFVYFITENLQPVVRDDPTPRTVFPLYFARSSSHKGPTSLTRPFVSRYKGLDPFVSSRTPSFHLSYYREFLQVYA